MAKCPILTQVIIQRGRIDEYPVECMGVECMWYWKCRQTLTPVHTGSTMLTEDSNNVELEAGT